jgi:hypothetical protein
MLRTLDTGVQSDMTGQSVVSLIVPRCGPSGRRRLDPLACLPRCATWVLALGMRIVA